MVSRGDLFRHDPLPVYLKNRDQVLRNRMGAIDSLADFDQRAEEILKSAVMIPVSMDRRRATLATSTSTEGLEVQISVPLAGSSRLLYHPPVGWTGQAPFGVVEAGDRIPGVNCTRLRIGHRFGGASSPANVRAWARGEVDQIQEALDLQAPVIQEYNVRAPGFVKAWAAARRAILQGAGPLDS